MKMRWRILASVLVGLLSGAGVFVWMVLQPRNSGHYPRGEALAAKMGSSGEVEFLTVVPCSGQEGGDPEKYVGAYQIVDSRRIDDAGQIRKLTTGVFGDPKHANLCIFEPRHALRRVGHPEDYILICLACWDFEYSYGSTGSGPLQAAYGRKMREVFPEIIEELGMSVYEGDCSEY